MRLKKIKDKKKRTFSTGSKNINETNINRSLLRYYPGCKQNRGLYQLYINSIIGSIGTKSLLCTGCGRCFTAQHTIIMMKWTIYTFTSDCIQSDYRKDILLRFKFQSKTIAGNNIVLNLIEEFIGHRGILLVIKSDPSEWVYKRDNFKRP